MLGAKKYAFTPVEKQDTKINKRKADRNDEHVDRKLEILTQGIQSK